MKQYRIILAFMMGLFMVASCTDDSLIKKREPIVEGIPTQVILAYESSVPKVVETKGALQKEDETRVNKLHIFVFNEAGTSLEILQSFDANSASGNVELKVTSGKKRIYAIANMGHTASNVNEISFSEIKSVNDLKNIIVQLKEDNYYRGGGNLLMSGYFECAYPNISDMPNGYCEIEPDNKVVLKEIKLKRVDARITFNIGLSSSSTSSGISNRKFTPKKWQVKNLPRKAYLLGDENKLYASDDVTNDYFQTPFANFESKDVETGNSTFAFYMMENAYTNAECTAYNDREKEVKGSDGLNTGKYLYAPASATYVVLTGDYSEMYTDKNGVKQERNAEVTYTIHLGFVGNDASDFEAERNTAYIYNVQVEGVDKIRLEVTSYKDTGETEENQPGAEGEIVETDQFLLFDSHFDQTTITFYKNRISDKAGVKVKTPFDEGYYVLDSEAINHPNAKPISQAKDLGWISFIKNTSSYKYAEYAPNNAISIQDLLTNLKDGTAFANGDEATYTVFINEFYYKKEPGKDIINKLLWKKFVNQSNRTMHILCNTEFSEDKESSLTSSSIMVSQRSIKTFYNNDENLNGLTTAWGIETVNETGMLEPGEDNPWNASELNKQNGRWNFFKQFDKDYSSYNKGWTVFISNKIVEDQNGIHDRMKLQSNNSKLVYSCLQRNRDENGNKTIDANEIKWYPAAINQLSDIWVGKDALPVESHLYPNGSNVYWRYLSSDGRELYAEEGSSINGWKFSYANSLGEKVSAPTHYDYRCVRNLGMDDTRPAVATGNSNYPQDYIQSIGDGFKLTYMAPAAVRPTGDFQNGEFASHDELSTLNRPYSSFKYKNKSEFVFKGKDAFVLGSGSGGEKMSWSYVDAQTKKNNSPCAILNTNGETGWRLPNQRELAIMSSRCSSDSWITDSKQNPVYCISRTAAAAFLTGKSGLGHQGGTSDGLPFMTIPSSGFTGPARCVKDLK